MTLWDSLKNEMLKNPFQIVCENNAKMTYEELVIFSESFSKKLKNEKCCAILCESELAAAMALLSCFAAGVTAVPLSAKYGVVHCEKILNTISPTAIITDMNESLQVTHLADAKYITPSIHPALIMCTSGTTGTPKGAMLTEENIIANTTDIIDYFDISRQDYILISRPLYHCAVLTGEFLVSLLSGAKIRFHSGTFNPKVLLDILTEHKITVFCGTPTLLSIMAKFRQAASKVSLRSICISGECMDEKTASKIATTFPNTYIYHVYGLTEACPRVCFMPPYLFKDNMSYVGKPLKSVQIKLVKENGETANLNEEGILWVKGPNVMVGYYNAPEQTARVLRDGWLCTGDIGLINEKGFLKILGRSDDLIIRGGMNIYPQEIESTLKTDSRVNEVMVYKVKGPIFGEQIGLKISGDFSDTAEVRKLCSEILPSFQIPSQITLLDELPKNGTGKIIRR